MQWIPAGMLFIPAPCISPLMMNPLGGACVNGRQLYRRSQLPTAAQPQIRTASYRCRGRKCLEDPIAALRPATRVALPGTLNTVTPGSVQVTAHKRGRVGTGACECCVEGARPDRVRLARLKAKTRGISDARVHGSGHAHARVSACDGERCARSHNAPRLASPASRSSAGRYQTQRHDVDPRQKEPERFARHSHGYTKRPESSTPRGTARCRFRSGCRGCESWLAPSLIRLAILHTVR
jgi:hypothetical protein